MLTILFLLVVNSPDVKTSGLNSYNYCLLAALGGCDDQRGQSDKSNGVGQNHQLVEHVGQLPDQIVGQAGTEEYEHQSDERVHGNGLLAEEIFHVDLTEVVPAEYGGECEEEKAHCNKDGAYGLAEAHGESQLNHIGLGDAFCCTGGCGGGERAVAGVESGDNDESGHGEDNEGIEEETDHGHDTLIVGLLDVCKGVGVGSRTHAGLIGEQTALCTLADSGLESITDAAADDGIGHECVLEDHADSFGESLDVDDDKDDAAHNVENCHNGDDLFGDGGNALDAAKENESCNNSEHKTYDPGSNTGCIGDGLADGVGLNHAAHEAQSQNGGYAEETGKEVTKAVGEGALDVVDRAAVDGTVLVDLLGLLSQDCLSIDGGHAEEGDDPHPEDSAGATDENSAGSTDDVAGTDLGRNCGGQGLEGAETALAVAAEELDVAENTVPAFFKAAELNAFGLNCEIKTCTYQKDDKYVVGKIHVDFLNDAEQ